MWKIKLTVSESYLTGIHYAPFIKLETFRLQRNLMFKYQILGPAKEFSNFQTMILFAFVS